jgi:hypothetical protein
MKNFIICTLHKILLGRTDEREGDMLEIINTYIILIGNLEGWKPLGKSEEFGTVILT